MCERMLVSCSEVCGGAGNGTGGAGVAQKGRGINSVEKSPSV